MYLLILSMLETEEWVKSTGQKQTASGVCISTAQRKMMQHRRMHESTSKKDEVFTKGMGQRVNSVVMKDEQINVEAYAHPAARTHYII